MDKKYNVFNGNEWKKVEENYVKDIKKKEEIDFIFEYQNGDIQVNYNDGSTKNYQNVHGNFVFQY